MRCAEAYSTAILALEQSRVELSLHVPAAARPSGGNEENFRDLLEKCGHIVLKTEYKQGGNRFCFHPDCVSLGLSEVWELQNKSSLTSFNIEDSFVGSRKFAIVALLGLLFCLPCENSLFQPLFA